jgi:hypothetical protein
MGSLCGWAVGSAWRIRSFPGGSYLSRILVQAWERTRRSGSGGLRGGRETRFDHSIGEALFNHGCGSQALGGLEQGGGVRASWKG